MSGVCRCVHVHMLTVKLCGNGGENVLLLCLVIFVFCFNLIERSPTVSIILRYSYSQI